MWREYHKSRIWGKGTGTLRIRDTLRRRAKVSHADACRKRRTQTLNNKTRIEEKRFLTDKFLHFQAEPQTSDAVHHVEMALNFQTAEKVLNRKRAEETSVCDLETLCTTMVVQTLSCAWRSLKLLSQESHRHRIRQR